MMIIPLLLLFCFYPGSLLADDQQDLSSSTYNFYGKNCSFFGEWTSSALSTATDIRRYVNQLKNNPKCAGIEKLVSDVPMPVYQNLVNQGDSTSSSNQSRYESLRGEISSLSQLLKSEAGSSSSRLFNILLGRTLESHRLSLNRNLSARSSQTMSYGLTLLDNVLAQLPRYDECLVNEPSIALSLFGGLSKMLAAFAGSGEGVSSKVGNTIFNFVHFLQDKKFTRILRKLSHSEYWMNLSCLFETVSETYCSAKDAYEMLGYSKKESQLYLQHQEEQEGEKSITFNPLEGYFILTREIPIVSKWIQKVMFGVKPRTLADAQFKNKVIDNVNELVQDLNTLEATYYDSVLNFHTLTNIDAKRNHVLTLIKDLTSKITGGSFMGGSRRGDVNFFSWAVLPALVPFKLIGRNKMPPEVGVNSKGQYSFPWDMWMENKGSFQPEFANPESLLEKIGVELAVMMEAAMEQGSSYYQRRLIVDRANLVDESVTSQTITVYEALVRIERYLSKLGERVKIEGEVQDLVILPNLLATAGRIKKILGIYEKLQNKTREYLDTHAPGEVNRVIVENDEFVELINGIIATVYSSFNVIIQRDTFLTTRMETFVRYDYAYHTRNKTNLSEYQQNLMIVAGKNLIDRLLNNAYGNNPALVRQDLAAAQVVNMRTMAAMERLFGHGLHAIIAENKLVADGEGDGALSKNRDSLKRLVLDAFHYYLYEITGDPNDLSFFKMVLWEFPGQFVFRMDKYPIYLLDFSEVEIPHDDQYGSYEQFKSRLCIQSLAFRRSREFYTLCKGSTLEAHVIDGEQEGHDDDERERLSSDYDQLLFDYLEADSAWKNSGGPKDKRENLRTLQVKYDRNICALRDYRRKNFAYWLLKQVAKDAE